MTEQTAEQQNNTGPAAAQQPAVTIGTTTTTGIPAQAPAWGEMFSGLQPQEVREAYDNSRKWENRSKENHQKVQELETTQQQVLQRATTAEQTAQAAQHEAMVLRVAVAKQLPADLLEFLDGEDQAGVEAKADKLLTRLQPGRTTGEIAQGPRGTVALNDDDNLLRDVKGVLGIR